MKRYGLIGYPLGHSFSQAYFTDKFRGEKIDAVYNVFPLKTIDELAGLIDKYGDLCGLNVTHPYKSAVIDYIDDLDERAEKAGAVNVISISWQSGERILRGFNTDIDGFVLSLEPLIDKDIDRALVLGTGGASHAVQAGLDSLGISYSVVSRSISRGDLTYSQLGPEHMKTCRLIINATPLGMFPDTGSAPQLPYDLLDTGAILYDLVYNPGMTLFLKKGQERGCRIKNGLEMLHIQAEKSWEIWNS